MKRRTTGPGCGAANAGRPAPLRVVCAVIARGGRVLAARRSAAMPHPGQWEFPGGKVRPGESDEAALARELVEELALRAVRVRARLPAVRRRAGGRDLLLIPLVCAIPPGRVRPGEHDRVRWLRPGELARLDWLAADRVVLEDFHRWRARRPRVPILG